MQFITRIYAAYVEAQENGRYGLRQPQFSRAN